MFHQPPSVGVREPMRLFLEDHLYFFRLGVSENKPDANQPGLQCMFGKIPSLGRQSLKVQPGVNMVGAMSRMDHVEVAVIGFDRSVWKADEPNVARA